MNDQIVYYEATVLKTDNTTVPVSKLITVEAKEDIKDMANDGKRKFMNMVLSEVDKWDLIIAITMNALNIQEKDIIL